MNDLLNYTYIFFIVKNQLPPAITEQSRNKIAANINWFTAKRMTANSKNTNIRIGTNFDFVLVCSSALLHEEEDAIFSIFQ